MKRIFDITVAGLALVVLFPLFVLIAAAVWLGEPGPILHRGERIGLGNRRFRMLKFRSMTLRKMHVNPSEITLHHDPRVTPIGRILRLTKCDELPQLFNVLRGEMSLVGPRPESPQYVAHYTAEQLHVLSIRPGITGLTQVYFRHEERLLTQPDPQAYYVKVLMPAKLALDLEYIRSHSLWRDIKLIAMTFRALIRPVALPAALAEVLSQYPAASPSAEVLSAAAPLAAAPLFAVTANEPTRNTG
jgi:lipopolysaccharide/colanic/teichoic acid biosynthesis glycosyltransferase